MIRASGWYTRGVRARFLSILVALALFSVAGAPLPLRAAPTAQDSTDFVRIDAPTTGARVSGTIEIRGRAVTSDPSRFQFYRLHYGEGAQATSMRPIGPVGDRPVDDGVLGTWATSTVLPGEYLILLTVYEAGGWSASARVVVTVEPPPTPAVRPTNAPIAISTPGEQPTPGPDGDQGPPPTPIPELPQLDPNIPQIDVPPPRPGPAGPNIAPSGADTSAPPAFAPPQGQPAPGPILPQAPASAPPSGPISISSAPSSDSGPASAAAISVPSLPPPPQIQPYEPPPALPTAPPPTPLGIPP